MNANSRDSTGLLATATLLCSAVVLAGIPTIAAGQTTADLPRASTADQGDWVVPRTAWGHPDLQGNWSNATLTPLQRPRGQGPVLTWEEVEAIERGEVLESIEAALPSDPDRPPPEAGGTNPVCIDSGDSCYNDVYIEEGTTVAVVNGEPRSSLVTRPSDGRVPAITDAGRARMAEARALTAGIGAFDGPEVRALGERCILSFGSNAGPPMLPNGWYNNNYTIVQNEDHVMIMAEMVHDARIVRLGQPDSLPSDMRPWLGESWGHWEGNTLVVETRNIDPRQAFRSVPPSEDTTIIERFTRVDEETILYEFTIDDPVAYAEPWGGEVPMKKFDDLLYEYACHEGNYALENILRGARYEERLEAEAGAATEPQR